MGDIARMSKQGKQFIGVFGIPQTFKDRWKREKELASKTEEELEEIEIAKDIMTDATLQSRLADAESQISRLKKERDDLRVGRDNWTKVAASATESSDTWQENARLLGESFEALRSEIAQQKKTIAAERSRADIWRERATARARDL
tara:strand:+ start:1627 stop:2064 length:438 start_codon:yes stop_codon:yes gene_type:complete